MYLIDSHCHLYAKNFEDDIEEVVQQSINNNVKKILLPNISSQTTDAMLNVCNKFSNCLPMMGLHPCEVNNNTYESELEHVEESLRNNNFIAVGEIGIDLYWNKETLEIQKEAFQFQIKLAKKYYKTEASGNIHLKNVKEVAQTGVNRISIGSLTHSSSALDLKLEI